MNEKIQQAVSILKQGRLVAFPTETVYGLGADAHNEAAIRKVFEVKGRPLNHPLIVHISNIEQLDDLAIDVPEVARALAARFWPGPLTFVLQKHPKVSNLITANQDTIAIRIPNHRMTLTMLQKFGSAIVGPSANSYGKISPTLAEHVKKDLGDKVDYILDGGECEVGIESTIIRFDNNNIQILRYGNITKEEILKAIQGDYIFTENKHTNIRVPGMLESHYSPTKPLFLVESKELIQISEYLDKKNYKCSYLCFQNCAINSNNIIWHQAEQQPNLYAKKIYSLLHQLDAENSKAIIVESPPIEPLWFSINDRLVRASKKFITFETLHDILD